MIELRNINFRYAGGTDAGGLVNIDLIIPDGQVILLCGQSGCGKTTLTRLVNGLIPNYYEGELSGEVLLDGKNSEICGERFSKSPHAVFYGGLHQRTGLWM